MESLNGLSVVGCVESAIISKIREKAYLDHQNTGYQAAVDASISGNGGQNARFSNDGMEMTLFISLEPLAIADLIARWAAYRTGESPVDEGNIIDGECIVVLDPLSLEHKGE